MSQQPYHRKLLECFLLGKCHSTLNDSVLHPSAENSKKSFSSSTSSEIDLNQRQDILLEESDTPQPLNSFLKSLNTSVTQSEQACTPCRVVGTVLFFGVSTYCGVLAIKASQKSVDRRLAGTLSITFGILGVFRALKN